MEKLGFIVTIFLGGPFASAVVWAVRRAQHFYLISLKMPPSVEEHSQVTMVHLHHQFGQNSRDTLLFPGGQHKSGSVCFTVGIEEIADVYLIKLRLIQWQI